MSVCDNRWISMFTRINRRRILRSNSGSKNEVLFLSHVTMTKKLVPGARIAYQVSGVKCYGSVIEDITEYDGRMYRVLNEDTGQQEDVARVQVLRVYSRDLQQMRPGKTIMVSIRKQGVPHFDCGLVRGRLKAIAGIVGNLDNQQIIDLLIYLREKYPQ